MRFNKNNVQDFILARMKYYQDTYKFNYGDGYSVVIGKGEELNRAFGEYSAYRAMLDSIESGL